jgi:hypothetical protein
MANAAVTVTVSAASARASTPQPTVKIMSHTAVPPSELPPPVVLDHGWEPDVPDVLTAHIFTIVVVALAVVAWWRGRRSFSSRTA